MFSLIRRIINSRVGVLVTFGVLAVIALAFAAGDVTGLAGNSGILGGEGVAKVGNRSVTTTDLRRRVQDELRAARQQQPDVTMAQLVNAGGVEALLERMVTGVALQEFGEDQGMRVSRALVGSELKNIPAFRGPTGQFDQQAYERIIAQQGLTDKQVQAEIARETMAQFLIAPTLGASQVPDSVALPYASLLLEQRQGLVSLIPYSSVPTGAAPTEAELADWYRRNVARYTVPERRVMRYVEVTPATVKAQAVPTDAEIQQQYKADAGLYQARQTRDVTLVTVLNQAAASALAAKVKSGTPIAEAARAAGLDTRTVKSADQSTLAASTSDAFAAAVFGAQKDAVVGPVRGTLGYVVGRVDAIGQVAGKSLEAARPEIFAKLTTQKTNAAIQKIRDAIEDSLADNSNINEVAAEQKLTVQSTPALLANGTDPDAPTPAANPAMAAIAQAGFAAEEGDTPTTAPLATGPAAQDGSFVVVALDRVVPAAPRPLAQIRDKVAADIVADRRKREARRIADAVLAKVRAGASLADAIRQTGLNAPAPRPIAAVRSQLNAQAQVNPLLALLFTTKQGAVQKMEAPTGDGWAILQVQRVVPGDARGKPQVIAATRADVGRVVGQEYVQQFTRAVTSSLGVKRNQGAIDKLKKDLLGGTDQ